MAAYQYFEIEGKDYRLNGAHDHGSDDTDDELDSNYVNDTKPFLRRDRDNDGDSIGPSSTIHERRRKRSVKYYGETESQQYEQDENEVWRHHQLQRLFEDKGHWWTFTNRREVKRWMLTLATGFACGVVAIFVTYSTKILTFRKFVVFFTLIEKEKSGEIFPGAALIFLFFINLLFAIVAWATVYIEPLASGSGIPEIKCYLNGLNIPGIVRMKTLVCKAVGIVFACSCGLPLGKEGPMVHAGAVIAAGVSQGKSNVLGCDTSFSKFQDFRNDREKRDFVACGAAAGVAAAFGAPIGGVLFSLEESASFWSTKLTWRCFFCAMMTVFTLYVITSAGTFFGHSDSTAMFSFGEFYSLDGDTSNYAVWELFLFMVIGAMGGLIGACFIASNAVLFRMRKTLTPNIYYKLLEVLGITGLMTVMSFAVPVIWSKCTPLPVDMEEWSDQEHSDTAIKQLFHFREIGDHNDSTFSSSALFIFLLTYIILACFTSGLAVPAGMFVPSLLSGSAFGRLVGHLLHKFDRTRGTFADSGTYALMGAAAICGGITRMTISLTVMILEGTGDMQYVLPLMLTVMSARLAGNVFTEGLYDIHIHSRHLHFLDEDESITHLSELYDITVSDIMTRRPICLKQVVRVGEVFDMLRKVKHHLFPVVDDDRDGGALRGTITRKVICTLLKHKAFGPASADPKSQRRISPLVNWGTLECIYPRYPDVDDLSITEVERKCWLDLRPYIDYAAYTVSEHSSIQRTYRMFRTLGLRHLCVMNHKHVLVGIITRADLVASHILTQAKAVRLRSVQDTAYISKSGTEGPHNGSNGTASYGATTNISSD